MQSNLQSFLLVGKVQEIFNDLYSTTVLTVVGGGGGGGGGVTRIVHVREREREYRRSAGPTAVTVVKHLLNVPETERRSSGSHLHPNLLLSTVQNQPPLAECKQRRPNLASCLVLMGS